MMEAAGDADSLSAGHAGEGDGDSLQQRLITHLARVDEALQQPVDASRPASTHPALAELRGMLAEALERLEAEADA